MCVSDRCWGALDMARAAAALLTVIALCARYMKPVPCVFFQSIWPRANAEQRGKKMIHFVNSCAKRKGMKPLAFAIAFMLSAFVAAKAAEDWKPVEGRLMTRWARDVSPKNAHPEYPRPQM